MEPTVRFADLLEGEVEGFLEAHRFERLGDLTVRFAYPRPRAGGRVRSPSVRGRGHLAREPITGQDQGPLDEVAVLVGEDLVPHLVELVPVEVGIVVLRREGRRVESDHVGRVVREKTGDEGVPGFGPGLRYFFSAHEQPLVRWDIVREPQSAHADQDRWPDDRVVELVVLPDEVVLADGFPHIPEPSPRLRLAGADRPLLRGRQVAGQGVKPDVEPLRRVPVQREGNAPVEVARDRGGVQALLEKVLGDAQRARAASAAGPRGTRRASAGVGRARGRNARSDGAPRASRTASTGGARVCAPRGAGRTGRIRRRARIRTRNGGTCRRGTGRAGTDGAGGSTAPPRSDGERTRARATTGTAPVRCARARSSGSMVNRSNENPSFSNAARLIASNRPATSAGLRPSFSAATRIGVPCMSDPETMSTSLPRNR